MDIVLPRRSPFRCRKERGSTDDRAGQIKTYVVITKEAIAAANSLVRNNQ